MAYEFTKGVNLATQTTRYRQTGKTGGPKGHMACALKERKEERNGVPQSAPTLFGLAAKSRTRLSRKSDVTRIKTNTISTYFPGTPRNDGSD